MSNAKVEDAFGDSVSPTVCVERRPLGKCSNLSGPFGDILSENIVGSGLGDFVSRPIDRLVKEMAVADGPESARVAVGNEVGSFDMLIILGVLYVGE